MAIFRGTGGSIDGLITPQTTPVTVSQGGTGATTKEQAVKNLLPDQGPKAGQYLKTDGTNTSWDAIDVGTADVAGILPVLNGGTGASNPTEARINILPSYSGKELKVLAVNAGGTDVEWSTVAGSGTVTSVALSTPTGLDVAGSPITSDGTLAVTYSAGYSIPTTAKQTEWDTAYGWGNHASAGYAADNTVVKLTGDQTVAGNKTFNATITGSVTGNAGTATALATGRTISATGDVAYTSGSFDGTGNVTGTATLATVNSNVGSFGSSSSIPVVTVNAKGLVTGVTTATVAGGQYFGTAATKAIAYNSNTIAENITITSGNNAMSVGNITISSGYSVTVESGCRWVVL